MQASWEKFASQLEKFCWPVGMVLFTGYTAKSGRFVASLLRPSFRRVVRYYWLRSMFSAFELVFKGTKLMFKGFEHKFSVREI